MTCAHVFHYIIKKLFDAFNYHEFSDASQENLQVQSVLVLGRKLSNIVRVKIFSLITLILDHHDVNDDTSTHDLA